jgi:hypothetical protein
VRVCFRVGDVVLQYARRGRDVNGSGGDEAVGWGRVRDHFGSFV